MEGELLKSVYNNHVPGFDLASRSILVAKERPWVAGRRTAQLVLAAPAAELCSGHGEGPAAEDGSISIDRSCMLMQGELLVT